MIDDSEISIVVQGPVIFQSKANITDHITQTVCQQLRKIFPGSELILSTWENENIQNISYDQVVFNKDPGATWFNYENYQLLNNCNRLIVSTLNGIKVATKPYILKLRSDLFLLSKSFLKYFDKYDVYDPTFKFVRQRIIAFGLYSIKAHKTPLFTMERPFHISDWAYFGFKEDMLNLYDIPLTNEPEFSQWFLTRCKPFFDIEPHCLWKMPPEQYVTSSFLNKFMPIQLAHTTDISNDNMRLSQQALTNNFLVLDQSQFQLVSLKYMNLQILFEPLLATTAIFFHTWLKDYCQVTPLVKAKKLRYRNRAAIRKIVFLCINFLLLSTNGSFLNYSHWCGKYIKYVIRHEKVQEKKTK